MCYYDRRKITTEDIEAYAGPIASSGARHALLQTSRQCIPPNADELIAKVRTITVPTLILWGRQDGVIPIKVGELLNKAIPNSTLEVIEHCTGCGVKMYHGCGVGKVIAIHATWIVVSND